MRKLVLSAMAMAMMFTLVGCSDSTPPATSGAKTTGAMTTGAK